MFFENNLVFIADKLVIITEILLYLSFSLLIGGILIHLIPEEKQPTIHLSKRVLLLSVAFIPILSFAPLLETNLILSENLDFWLALKNIVFTFEIGKAWLFTVVVSILLYFLLYKNNLKNHPSLAKLAIFLTVLLVMGLGYGSHASSITDWRGFVVHSAHFLSVIIWVGLLLVVAWFSHDHINWRAFLKWFTPLAMVCVTILAVTGYFTMEIDIQNYDNRNASIFSEYQNSWLVNYGQALLMKHLLIIPLLLYAFTNGFIIKSKLKKDANYNPIKWVKVESLYALFVFSATAFMGQGYPPHQVELLLKSGLGPSPLFDAIYQGDITPTMSVTLDFGSVSYLLFSISFLFMGLVVLSVLKKAPAVFSFLIAFFLVTSAYLGLMLGVR